MALQGTLKDFGLADIFQLISIQRKTGVLTLKRDGEVVTVSFLKGQVVSADTLKRRLEQRVGALLVKTGRITHQQLAESLRIQTSTLQKLGSIMLAERMITPADLKEILHVQITQIVYGLFRWRNGHYEFSQDENVDYDRELFTPVGAETLLMEGARMIDEWPIIERRIPSLEMVFRRTGQAASLLEREDREQPDRDSGQEEEDGGPTAEEMKVLRLVDGRMAVSDLIDFSLMGEFETCRVLHDLLQKELIEEAAGPAGERDAGGASPAAQWTAVLRFAVPALAVIFSLTIPWNPLLSLGGHAASVPEWAREAVSRSRMTRLELALHTYQMENGSYPATLDALARERFASASDLADPLGRPYVYQVVGSGFLLRGLDSHGRPDPALFLMSRTVGETRVPPASLPD
jgi:hypothetical protein